MNPTQALIKQINLQQIALLVLVTEYSEAK